MTKIRCIAIICICMGLCVITIPFIKEHQADKQRQMLLGTWKNEKIQAISLEQDFTNKDFLENETKENHLISDTVGILTIPVIDFEEPILRGATTEHLNISVSTIEPTGNPGEFGNFVIAGHNSRNYGRHFNRLDELESGDEIFIESQTGAYVYIVTEKYIVDAEDVWVLEHESKEAELTLITCYYMEDGEKKRLIVKGVLAQ